MRLRLGLSLSLLLVAMPLAAQHAYISSQAANKITVLDIDTQKITATVEVTTGPVGVSLDNKRHELFVTHPEQGVVTMIDTRDNKKLAEINTGGQPF